MWNNVFRWSTQYSKHPPKISNQESGKTAFPTFARSFAAFYAAPSHRSRRSIYFSAHRNRIPKHPPKMANQESGKIAFPTFAQSFEPSFTNMQSAA